MRRARVGTLTKARAELTFASTRVHKRFFNPRDCRAEVDFYLKLQFGHPELLDYDDQTLVIERLTPVTETDLRPARALAELVAKLHQHGVSHRDVHPGNIVLKDGEPLLIDWETGIDRPGYDLFGPASGIPVPSIHKQIDYAMWVASDHRASILRQWKVDLRQYCQGVSL
ncbi:serine/threonine kinase [Mycobacterium phage Schatzie]|nr:serine/threonine kinase [Mycobacterium phage Schatzie]